MSSRAHRSPRRLDAERCWQAYERRDPRFDGRFFAGITTTGIFCRPVCPARRPRREHLRFFPDAGAAARAGFRPCLRCRPESTPGSGAWRGSAAVVARAERLIEAGVFDAGGIAALADRVGLGARQLRRLFAVHRGVSPSEAARRLRAERARRLLLAPGGRSMAEIAGRGRLRQRPPVQRRDPARVPHHAGRPARPRSPARRFHESGVVTVPAVPCVRAPHPEEPVSPAIAWTLTDTDLGRLLVAATERGVCRIAFVDDPAAAEAELRAEFPCATLARDDAALAPAAAALAAYAEGRSDRLELPLDVGGSRFRRRVWAALAAIPRGETRSYADVARAIGAPQAARAVAGACAANPLAVAIPCHRVVASDGGLGGYRWGIARKRLLLGREAYPAARGVTGGTDGVSVFERRDRPGRGGDLAAGHPGVSCPA
jgi:AraC family transcriptional regulator of adaptative response/methylated-DNA-[protein]-cysteine methyltransferase